MRRSRGVFVVLWLFAPAVWADTTCEIGRLLGFIERSQCTFIRNGDEYSAADARTHIERKYDYAKRWIETTEQFVEYTATESSTSGEAYSVTCSGRTEPSADWLKRELARIRTKAECAGGR